MEYHLIVEFYNAYILFVNNDKKKWYVKIFKMCNWFMAIKILGTLVLHLKITIYNVTLKLLLFLQMMER